MLKAGEEQVIDVDVWTDKQAHIDINIQATGQYDLETKVSKRVKVMRPSVLNLTFDLENGNKRGMAMNPNDHPMGGGNGHSKGHTPVSPTGVPSKGYRTRTNKRTAKMIIRSRHLNKKK